MPSKKKKQNVYERATHFYWQQHQDSPLMKERHPNVRVIEISVDYKDPDGWAGDPKSEVHTFGPEQKAFFQTRCPYRECVNGGFNYAEGVRLALESPSNEASGRVSCDGWQDQERINRHRCMLGASFKVSVRRV